MLRSYLEVTPANGATNKPELSPRTLTNDSFRSQVSDTSVWISPAGWNVSKLLELSDTVRAALDDGEDLKPTELADLALVLGMMVSYEMDDAKLSKVERASHKIDILSIQRARLDKLLADMMRADDKAAKPGNKFAATGLWPEIEIARSLQKSWRERFKIEYLSLDRRRCDDLIAGGLCEMLFSSKSGGREDWSQETVGLSEKEGMTHFLPGQ